MAMHMDIFLRMHMRSIANVNKQIQNKHAKCMRMPALYKHENNHHTVHCLAWQANMQGYKKG